MPLERGRDVGERPREQIYALNVPEGMLDAAAMRKDHTVITHMEGGARAHARMHRRTHAHARVHTHTHASTRTRAHARTSARAHPQECKTCGAGPRLPQRLPLKRIEHLRHAKAAEPQAKKLCCACALAPAARTAPRRGNARAERHEGARQRATTGRAALACGRRWAGATRAAGGLCDGSV